MGKPQSGDKSGNNGVLKKGPWTAEEDQKLVDYIQKNGHGKWRLLPKNAGNFIFIQTHFIYKCEYTLY